MIRFLLVSLLTIFICMQICHAESYLSGKTTDYISFGFMPAPIIFMAYLVLTNMLGRRKYFEVFEAIIERIAVNMMDNLCRFKFSTKMFFHNKAMFKHPATTKLFSCFGNLNKHIRFTVVFGIGLLYSFCAKGRFVFYRGGTQKMAAFFRATFIWLGRIGKKPIGTDNTSHFNSISFSQMSAIIRAIITPTIFNLRFIQNKFTPTYLTSPINKLFSAPHVLIILFILTMSSTVNGENFMYAEMSKQINGDYKYSLPKLELNQAKWAGNFFGNKCYYLSEFEGGLVYSAPRSRALSLNHHSITAEWNLGVEVVPFFMTYSIGADYYIAGNSDGIPEGIEGRNTARIGVIFP